MRRELFPATTSGVVNERQRRLSTHPFEQEPINTPGIIF